MIHLVTFASDDMSKSAELCVSSAEAHGVDTHALFTTGHIARWNLTSDTVKRNASLFGHPRGCGFWAWKPLVLEASMRSLRDGEIVIYADAGIEFIENVNYIIDRMDQDIFLFGNMYEHAHWCKRDVIETVAPGLVVRDPDGVADGACSEIRLRFPWLSFKKQAQASVIFFRVSNYTRAFVKEWLDWCLFEGGRLIDDSPSRTPNHPEFRENRHDQAILTTMAYRDGIKLHWWPAQYNDGAFVYERGDYPDEGYPVLFHHHRKRNHEWSVAA